MFELISIVSVLLLSTLIAVLLCRYILRQPAATGSRYFAGYLACVAGYSLTIAIELMCPGLGAKIFWSKVQYVFLVNAAPLWLLFCLTYAGHNTRLTARRAAVLWFFPALCLILALTNEWHHLTWPGVHISQDSAAGLAVYEHGPAIWLIVAYSYTMSLTGTALLLFSAIRLARVYRWQTAALILAVLLPWTGNLLYVSRIYPFQYFDSAPVFFTLSGLLLTWAIFRYRLFQFSPVIADKVLRIMREGLLILDNQQRILDLNPAAGDMLGLSRDAIGSRLPEALPGVPELEHLGRTPGESCIPLDGAHGHPRRWIEAAVSAIPAGSGRPLEWLVFLRDLTERRRHEVAELRDRERSQFMLDLHTMAESGTESELYDFALEFAVKVTESEIGYLHQVNDETKTIQLTAWSGQARKQCTAIPDDHYPLEQAGVWADCARLRKPVIHNDYQEIPDRKGYPEGHAHLTRHLSLPLVLEDRVVMIIGVGNKIAPYDENDVHQLELVAGELEKVVRHLRMEDALKRLSLAVEQSPASIVITDADGNIVYVNRGFVESSGYAREEALGINPRILKSGQTPQEEYQRLWDTLKAGKAWSGEFVNKRKNGEIYTEWASVSPVFDRLGAITHYVAVKEDITPRRALEAQILQSQKMESIGRLAGGIAHDFNNMLAAILGYAELALYEVKRDTQLHEHLGEIVKAATRSAELTRQLLAFARKQMAMPQVINLHDTVAHAMRMLRRLIGENIDLTTSFACNLWLVRIDPFQVEQILTNLIVNARDAIKGAGTVAIELSNVELIDRDRPGSADSRTGEFVRLAVRDDGTGMEASVLKHVFEPFFTTKGVGEGTGLGLATVYGIATQNGGFVDVVSAPGRGTTFFVHLPRHMADSEPEPEPEPGRPQRGTETILVVEDEKSLLNLTRTSLEQQGYTVLGASSARAALRVVEHSGGLIDLMLTDIVMPEMDGVQLSLRMQERIPGIKCLFMSGYPQETLAQQGLVPENLPLIQKPFSPQALGQRIRDMLDA